ncbi:cupin domain-containing protein [Sulfitobacter guttiformis]|uniref:(S)-ureidoglycine aminohydrolase cupin domain-containing protein n=1 Tax=Sulfitobacter guttiformis TaxID=74349 RepID=A0A420DRI0_9RHOB|nr:cupin domain-containing protein [Sulfitobacter guttiformis]KIN74185.1 putative enzyme of the cupin superfamily [Sulfitobacter guttiformis KCTC 32187]RKE96798.1 hypothetical protein C8N30_1368 [Sulfitobacter guttiformis]
MTQAMTRMEKTGEPVIGAPPTGDIIDGAPEFRTWKLDDVDGLRCGLWQCTPGKWSMTYDVWEYVRILEGKAIITPADEDPVELEAGDSYILRVGLRCTWDVKQTILKEFVIRA